MKEKKIKKRIAVVTYTLTETRSIQVLIPEGEPVFQAKHAETLTSLANGPIKMGCKTSLVQAQLERYFCLDASGRPNPFKWYEVDDEGNEKLVRFPLLKVKRGSANE